MVAKDPSFIRRAYSGLTADIWVISGALFVNRFGTMVLPYLTLYLTETQGYSDFQAGLMLSVYGGGAMLGAWLGGKLARPVGPIRLQIILFLLAVPVLLVLPLMETAIGLALALATLSVFSAGVRPANSTAIAILAPEGQQLKAFGLQRLALNLGFSFGPAIGGFLATISFGWLFVVDAATTLACALVLLIWFGWRSNGAQEKMDEQLEEVNGRPSVSPLADREFVCFSMLLLAAAIVFFQFHVTYPLYLKEQYGLSKPATGLIYTVNTVVIVLFEMFLLEVVRSWSMIRVIGWGALFSCIGFGMLPFGNSVGYCVLSMLVITLGEMLWMPLATAWVAQRSARGDRGQYMGWYAMTYSAAAVIAPLVGGGMSDFHRDSFWYLSLLIGVACFIGFRQLAVRLELQESYGASGNRPPSVGEPVLKK